jgi:hypothetical protein
MECGKPYIPIKDYQRFCKLACRVASHKAGRTIGYITLKEFPLRYCRECGKRFKPKRQWEWFCTSNCDKIHHEKNVKIGKVHEPPKH